jgi:hypothetical protein
MDTSDIFDPADLEALLREGHAEHLSNGMIRLQKIVMFKPARNEEQYIDCPQKFHSVQSYEYLGFDRPTAEYLWNIWLTAPIRVPDEAFARTSHTFVWYAQQYIEAQPRNGSGLEADWDGLMKSYGMNDRARLYNMKDELEYIRIEYDVKSWIQEQIEATY